MRFPRATHLPLYRQEKILAHWGAPISRQNLSDWVGAATALLEPLVKRMQQELLAGGYVQADETPIRCNDPDLRAGKTTQGWLVGARAPALLRSSERPRTAERVLRLISGLYELEAKWNEAQVGDKRAALRQEQFTPRLLRLRWLVTALQARASCPSLASAKPVPICSANWQPLTAHLRHSHTRPLSFEQIEAFTAFAPPVYLRQCFFLRFRK